MHRAMPFRVDRLIVIMCALAPALAAQDLKTTAPSITVTGSANQASVTWSVISAATRYDVMRHEITLRTDGTVASSTPWASIAAVSGGAYADVLPKPSVLYEYRIDALLRIGATVSSNPVRYAAPAFTTPGNLTIRGSGTQATVAWTAATGVTGYNVWRRVVRTDGSTSDLTQRTGIPITSSTFDDLIPTPGALYEYQVVSIDAAGGQWPSAWARYASPAPTIVLTPPVLTIAGSGGDKALLSWSAVNGAASYRVSRVQLDASGIPVGRPVALSPAPTAVTLMDQLPAPSTNYAYTVTALTADYTSSATSPNVAFSSPSFTTPGTITVAGGGGKVGLTWCAASAVGGYQVWRRTVNADGSITDLSQRSTLLAVTGFVDVIPTARVIYEYQVVGIGMDGRLWPSAWVRFVAGTW